MECRSNRDWQRGVDRRSYYKTFSFGKIGPTGSNFSLASRYSRLGDLDLVASYFRIQGGDLHSQESGCPPLPSAGSD